MTQVPSTGTPVCYRHPSKETYIRCVRCDRPICPSCMTPASVGHQCPECVAEGRKTQRQVRTAFGGTRAGIHGYVTIGLIVINCVVMLFSVLSAKNGGNALFGGGIFGGGTPLTEHTAVVGQGAYANNQPAPFGVADGEYYRLLTAMFTHYGLIHLALNCYSLWIIGRPLEAMFGPVRFAAIYLVCGLGGNVAAYVFSPAVATAGASTAIFGLFGVLIFALRKLNLSTQTIMPVIVMNIVFTLWGGGAVSIPGHFGGFATGLVLGYGLSKAPQKNRTQVQAALLIGVVLVLGLITVWQTNQLQQLAL
jgi:membrane associated rhomboid family serine protease